MLHPASVKYSSDNKKKFDCGIDNFNEMMETTPLDRIKFVKPKKLFKIESFDENGH